MANSVVCEAYRPCATREKFSTDQMLRERYGEKENREYDRCDENDAFRSPPRREDVVVAPEGGTKACAPLLQEDRCHEKNGEENLGNGEEGGVVHVRTGNN